MATHTITTSVAQEAVLQWVVERVNADKGTNFTVDDLLQQQVPGFLTPYEKQFQEADEADLLAKYRHADAEKKAEAKGVLV